MNTMVGLQASLHTSVGGGIDLAKNELEDLEFNGDDSEGFGDVFDADELLNSPLFNEPANKQQRQQVDDTLEDSFGSFAIDDKDDNAEFEPIKSPVRITEPLPARPAGRVMSPKRTVSGPSSFATASSPYQSPTKLRPQPPFTMMPTGPPRSPPKLAAQRSPHMAPVRQSPKRAVSYNEGSVQGMAGMPQDMRLQQMQQQLSQMSATGSGNGLSQSMHAPFTAQTSPQVSAVPTTVHIVAPQGGDALATSMQSNSIRGQSMHAQPLGNVSTHGQPLGGVTAHSQQSMQAMNPALGVSSGQQQLMQQGPQAMNPQMISAQQLLNAQAMNGQPMNVQQMPNQQLNQPVMNQGVMNGQCMPNQQAMNPQMNGQQMLTQPGAPPFASFQGNISIATDMHTAKPNMQQAGMAQNPALVQGKKPATINDAMEKLCESMKRSAMTRSLVKQISSRSISRQNSARNMLSRQGSSRGIMRQNSGRGMMRQNSARGMLKQRSNRSLMDEGSGRGPAPIRHMSSSKHILQHHGRGLYRHDSQQSLNSQSAHGMNLHIDGRNVGTF